MGLSPINPVEAPKPRKLRGSNPKYYRGLETWNGVPGGNYSIILTGPNKGILPAILPTPIVNKNKPSSAGGKLFISGSIVSIPCRGISPRASLFLYLGVLLGLLGSLGFGVFGVVARVSRV